MNRLFLATSRSNINMAISTIPLVTVQSRNQPLEFHQVLLRPDFVKIMPTECLSTPGTLSIVELATRTDATNLLHVCRWTQKIYIKFLPMSVIKDRQSISISSHCTKIKPKHCGFRPCSVALVMSFGGLHSSDHGMEPW